MFFYCDGKVEKPDEMLTLIFDQSAAENHIRRYDVTSKWTNQPRASDDVSATCRSALKLTAVMVHIPHKKLVKMAGSK